MPTCFSTPATPSKEVRISFRKVDDVNKLSEPACRHTRGMSNLPVDEPCKHCCNLARLVGQLAFILGNKFLYTRQIDIADEIVFRLCRSLSPQLRYLHRSVLATSKDMQFSLQRKVLCAALAVAPPGREARLGGNGLHGAGGAPGAAARCGPRPALRPAC